MTREADERFYNYKLAHPFTICHQRRVSLGVYLRGKGSNHDTYVWKKVLSYFTQEELEDMEITVIYNEELYRDIAADGIKDFIFSDICTTPTQFAELLSSFTVHLILAHPHQGRGIAHSLGWDLYNTLETHL